MSHSLISCLLKNWSLPLRTRSAGFKEYLQNAAALRETTAEIRGKQEIIDQTRKQKLNLVF
jgi:hypothetical protein